MTMAVCTACVSAQPLPATDRECVKATGSYKLSSEADSPTSDRLARDGGSCSLVLATLDHLPGPCCGWNSMLGPRKFSGRFQSSKQLGQNSSGLSNQLLQKSLSPPHTAPPIRSSQASVVELIQSHADSQPSNRPENLSGGDAF